MEINFEGRLRRTEQLIRPDGKKKADTASSAAQPKADNLSPSSLSQQTIETLREQSQRINSLLGQPDQQKEKKPAIWDMVDGGGENGGAEAEMLGEQMKTMMRCQKIAARIMRGDKVPPEDERYLMENDPDGYKLALAMRQPKKSPKEWDSVLKDEEEKSSGSGGEEGAEPVSSGEGIGEASGAGG
ncbi:MAG: hypothetical protein K2N78_02410, partial [Oscillospiraceae bacterium]|nr:hypothetical protein [Oscillospiraceae bacterium]